LIAVDYELWNPLIYDFDGAIAQSPNDIDGKFADKLLQSITAIDGKTVCKIFDIEKYVREKMYLSDGRDKLYRGIVPSFDNSARRVDNAHIINVTPKLYSKWLFDIMHSSMVNFDKGNRFVFINAWNEWAEGAYLEPDRKYGFAYLQATAETLLKFKMQC